MEQSARITQLERRHQNSYHKLYHMSVLNQDLHAKYTAFTQTLADQEITIATLKTDLANQKSISDKSSQQVSILESTVTEMRATISMLERTIASFQKESFKEQPSHLNSMKPDAKSSNNIKVPSVDDSEEHSNVVRDDKSETNSHEDTLFNYARKNGEDTRQSKGTKESKPRQIEISTC